MPATTFGTVGQTPTERAAAEAWQRYARTCAMWGTPAERAHAFHAALEAERKVSRLELAHRSGR
jgi:hypothetical protein